VKDNWAWFRSCHLARPLLVLVAASYTGQPGIKEDELVRLESPAFHECAAAVVISSFFFDTNLEPVAEGEGIAAVST
jgi:hypothetical protein